MPWTGEAISDNMLRVLPSRQQPKWPGAAHPQQVDAVTGFGGRFQSESVAAFSLIGWMLSPECPEWRCSHVSRQQHRVNEESPRGARDLRLHGHVIIEKVRHQRRAITSERADRQVGHRSKILESACITD